MGTNSSKSTTTTTTTNTCPNPIHGYSDVKNVSTSFYATNPTDNVSYTYKDKNGTSTTYNSCMYEINSENIANQTNCEKTYLTSGTRTAYNADRTPSANFNSPAGTWNSFKSTCTFYLNKDARVDYYKG